MPSAPKSSKKVVGKKVVIDCSAPVTDKVLDLSSFEKFLHDKVKVDNKCPAKSGAVTITRDGKSKVTVSFASADSSKRYVKYLTKKYLKKQQLKNYLRVVQAGKGGYVMKYYKYANNDAADDA